MKKLILLIFACVIWSCEKEEPIVTTVTPTKTGRVELASVCAQTTFMVDDSGFFTGPRLGIYRSGRCEFVAYIEMEDIGVDIDPESGDVTITCPQIKIADPKYHYDELVSIYKVKGMVRDWITQKEKHDFENKEVKHLQDSLMKSKTFTEALKNKGKASAKILLPRLFSYNRELKPKVEFE